MKKGISKKILCSILTVSAISLIIFFAVSQFSISIIKNAAMDGNKSIGDMAGNDSKISLLNQASENIADIALAKSETIELKMQELINSTAIIKDYIEDLYRNSQNYKAIPLLPPNPDNGGKLVMQAVTAPDLPPESLQDEMQLLGNVESIFSSVMNSYKSIACIYLTTESGISIGYDINSDLKPQSFDGREVAWYINAKENNELTITDVYQDSFDRGAMVSVSVPFYGADGIFMGVLGLDMLLNDFNNNIIGTKIGDNGYVVLVGADKTIISDDKNSQEDIFGTNADSILNKMTDGKTGTDKTTVLGNKMHVAFAPVEIAGWSVAVLISADEVIVPALKIENEIMQISDSTMKKVDRQINAANLILVALFIVIIGIVTLISLSISRKMSAPILKLSEEVKIIGGGELEFDIIIKTGDEIEALADSFNKMKIDLKKYIANLSDMTAEKERIGAELNIATQIQASMLPCIFPPYPNRNEFDIYGSMLPAKEVGGDFYDFFLVDDDNLCLTIADVSGKGVPAALFMVIAKTLIKNNVQNRNSPKEVFETVNNLLCENNEAGMFVTAFMGILQISTGRFTYVNAGHNPPLICHNGNFEWLPTKPGFVLAGMENMRYRQNEIMLSEGDILYMYTDGVTEAVDTENNLFTEKKLLADINKFKDKRLSEILIGIKREIDIFANGAEQADDITMLAMKFLKKGEVRQ